jgi:transposase InsO family protein
MNREELEQLVNEINSHRRTLKQGAKSVHMRESRLKNLADEAGLELELNRGRPMKEITPTARERSMEYVGEYMVGCQRCFQSVSALGVEVTERQMRRLFDEEDLWGAEADYKPPDLHQHRFVARYVGQIWHTDLHYLKREKDPGSATQRYLIAFIDDRSRYVLYWEILSDKTMDSVARAFDAALRANPRPYSVTCDNGMKFVGEAFQDLLETQGVRNWRTQPYTPEQNGKIERRWRTLEKSCKTYEAIDNVIDQYNQVWPHRSLTEMAGVKTTPAYAWQHWAHWQGHDDLVLDYGQE